MYEDFAFKLYKASVKIKINLLLSIFLFFIKKLLKSIGKYKLIFNNLCKYLVSISFSAKSK